MKRLRRFLGLPAAERRLLIKAALLLWAIKLGLMLLPFRTMRNLLGRLTGLSIDLWDADRYPVERVVWAVELAGRLMPRASTCLTEGLTAQVLLLRRGHPALLHIGAVKGEGGELQAHAWVESRGEVVIGGGELERFTPLVALEGEKALEGERQ